MEHKATGAARNSETIIVRRLPAVATSPPVARRRCGDGAGWGCAPTANRASSDGQCSLVSARIVLFHGSRRRRPPVVRAGRCCSALAAAVVRQGLHPRIICEGYDLARDHIIAKLDEWKVPLKPAEGGGLDREILESVARTSLRTKLNAELAETHLREHSAVSCCRRASLPQWVTVTS